MTYDLLTCEPEHFYDDDYPWTLRESFMDRDVAMDAIKNPSFDAQDFLMAKIRVGFLVAEYGAYRDGVFYSLTHDSDLRERHDRVCGKWNFGDLPIPEAMKNCELPSHLTDLMIPYVDEKLIIKCMILSLDEHSSFASMFLSWLNGMTTSEEILLYTRSFHGDFHKNEIARFYLNKGMFSTAAWSAIRTACNSENDSDRIRRIREIVPMRLFLRGILR